MVTYYISPTGNDNNDGLSPINAWQTISKLTSHTYQENDIISFERNGKWKGNFNVPRSNIKLTSHGEGNKPIIHGWDTITDWDNEGNGIYSSETIPLDDMKIITINNIVYRKGRFPKTSWLPVSNATGTMSGTVSSNSLQDSPDFSSGKICINKNDWVIDQGIITDHTNNTISFSNTSGTNASNSKGFFIYDNINCLTEFGEWMYDNQNNKLYIYFGSEDPVNYTINASTVENVLRLSERSNVEIENIKVEGANAACIRLSTYSHTNNSIIGCEFDKSGFDAIRMFGWNDYTTIINCDFNDIGNKAIETHSARHVLISGNNIENVGLYPELHENGSTSSGSGIVIAWDNHRCGNSTVSFNTVKNVGYLGIRGNGSDLVIENNIIEKYNQTKIDGGGIYLHGRGQGNDVNDVHENRIVRRNIVSNPDYTIPILHTSEAGYGIYLDEQTRNVLLEYNTVFDNSVGLYLHCAGDIEAKYNVFYNHRGTAMILNNTTASTNEYGEVNNLDIQFNVIYIPTDRLAIRVTDLKNENPDGFGIIDNNYYIKPMGGNIASSRSQSQSTITYNLEDWKQLWGYDQNTVGSPTSSEIHELYINYTEETQLTNIGYNRIDVNGNPISTPQNIEAFYSLLVLEGTNISPVTSNKKMLNINGGLMKYNNKLISSIN